MVSCSWLASPRHLRVATARCRLRRTFSSPEGGSPLANGVQERLISTCPWRERAYTHVHAVAAHGEEDVLALRAPGAVRARARAAGTPAAALPTLGRHPGRMQQPFHVPPLAPLRVQLLPLAPVLHLQPDHATRPPLQRVDRNRCAPGGRLLQQRRVKEFIMQTEPDNKPPKLVVTTQGFPLGVDCTLNGLSVCGAKHTCRQWDSAAGHLAVSALCPRTGPSWWRLLPPTLPPQAPPEPLCVWMAEPVQST